MSNEITPSALKITQGAYTSAGVKEENEDCIGGRWAEADSLLTKGFATVVSDGVSAASGGKIAAELCVNGFLSDYFSTPDSWSILTSASMVLDGLNRWLYSQANSQGLAEERGYVCTFSSLVLCSRSAYIFHIGDSRVYRIRGENIEQLTRDHRTVMREKQDYLNRAMGLNLHLKADYKEVEVKEGDLFILCTDGVHDWVSDKELSQSYSDSDDLDKSTKEIVDLASKAGSDDNLSCVAVRVDKLPEGSFAEVQRTLKQRPIPPIFSPGQVVDGLKIEDIIFESNRSQLYLVSDVESGVKMVMKTPSPNFEDNPDFIERFITEEWIGKRISHENIVKVISRERPASFLYYLMELLEGESVADWLKKQDGNPSVDEVVLVLGQLISGVRALHRKETLHQDLKLDNVFINSDGKVKVIDLGSCSIKGMVNQQTQKETLNTVDFAAPEYRLETEIGPKADQFSIAMIGYQALSGGSGPYGDSWGKAQTLRDFSLLEYKPLYHKNPMVPVWVDGAFKKALSINSLGRYDVLSEFFADLKEPNPEFTKRHHMPLIDGNPLLLWKVICLVQLVIIVTLILRG